MLDQPTFNEFAPEYAALSAPAFAAFLAVATTFTDGPIWVVNVDYATAQMLAHMLKMRDKAAIDGGALASERIGQFSQAFMHTSVLDTDLALTSYGKEFMRVRNMQPRIGFISY